MQTPMDETIFWQIIESAWLDTPALASFRATVLATNDATLMLMISDHLYQEIALGIKQRLLALDKTALTRFIHLMEEKLYHLDRDEIHEYTDGSEEGFLYCRCFIIGMGQAYYKMIDESPAKATPDVEAEIIGFIGYDVYEEKFGETFHRHSIYNIASGSNNKGW
ncbi:DUF4240 domain-containing protein [Chitinophaga nivalis]|uniref:DUF4240 domain-containing protein n=1 Tax=Chitinophaga nivalis TaxID=2991709 RepID=A0ABT3IS47_9BACT|nr:DUF4240 domain-containing protein [Chitinophaga nivalis]MCW3463776.1 DUF4240 domain-containing protein [Chitinophaga nivalis]MCW3486534.1 DUF4240 domain-containing protein [Chitinophaga nivalis]